jgi:hypothetical protein
MSNSSESKFTPALRNLLTGTAAYVANLEANELLKAANSQCDDQEKPFFKGCRFSPYFPYIPEKLDDLVDTNPRFGLASYHLPEADQTYVKNLIENELLVPNYRTDWEATFEYAFKQYDVSLQWAKTWLLTTLPELASQNTYPGNLDKEVGYKTHHALVLLQKACPMPGFASAQFFHALFDGEFAGCKNLKHHRALYADFKTGSGLPPWTATFLLDSGKHVPIGEQQQALPDCNEFKTIQNFFESRLGYAFNTDFDWSPRGTGISTTPRPDEKPDFSKPKGHEKQGIFRLLAFPVFESQVVASGVWSRKGPYIGLFALIIDPESNKSPEQLLECADGLGFLLNGLAAPIQAAREREFWSSRISERLDDQSMQNTLREYATTFCGVAIAPTTSFTSVTTVSEAIQKLKADDSGFVLPPLEWPDQSERKRSTAWEAKWLPTTMLPSSPDELEAFGHATMSRLSEAEKRIAAIRYYQEANRLKGVLESKHDYSKDLNSNDIRMDRYERHVKKEREKLQTLIEKTSALETIDASGRAKSSVVEGLKEVHREYGVPLLDLMALTRYQMMRQKAKDASSLYEEPQFCVERLIDGTKNDLVRVVNLLVWMRSPEWIDPARASQENGRDFAAWGRIFAYETVASNHLSRIAEHLFHNLGFQLEELDHYFPRPLLRCLVPQDGGERESALTEPFLWPQHEGNPVRPHLFGFFPLFVEAMRSAYLHAYAATLDRVLTIGRKQDVPRRAVGVQHPFQQFITLRPIWRLEADGRVRDYRLKISFSGPPSPTAPSIATLPLGDWHSETACFQRLVSQWKASEATEVIAGQQAPAFSITIASH